MKAIIDADIIIYEAASICESSIPWPFGDDGDVLWTRSVDLDEAWVRLNDSISVLTNQVGADEVALCVTDTDNFRFDFYGDYKSNRKSGVKPMGVPLLRQRLAEDPRGFRRPRLEGDDCMGILQTMPSAGDTICVTIDKDLRTIPGRHYNFRTKEFFEVTEAEADQYHLIQTLMGDQTDGYPGCRGIGEKKAWNMIPDPVEDVAEAWSEIVVPAFEKAGFDEAFALSQARCARILRASDYDPKNKEVIPWTPK